MSVYLQVEGGNQYAPLFGADGGAEGGEREGVLVD